MHVFVPSALREPPLIFRITTSGRRLRSAKKYLPITKINGLQRSCHTYVCASRCIIAPQLQELHMVKLSVCIEMFWPNLPYEERARRVKQLG